MYLNYSRVKLVMKRLLGKGEFGIVHKAIFQDEVVAVKQLKPGATTSQAQAFIEECLVMKLLSKPERRHPNVVHILGVTLQVGMILLFVLTRA